VTDEMAYEEGTFGAAEWARVGRYIEERINELGLNKRRVKDRGGPSLQILNDYIDGGRIGKPYVGINLCKALDWTTDSIVRILKGGEPLEQEWPHLENEADLRRKVEELANLVARLEAGREEGR
jgi:hypothetical protein